MIIVMTNRSLPSVPQNQVAKISVKNLGVNLGAKVDGKDRLYTGMFESDEDGNPQYSVISFYPKGSESKLFNSIPAKEFKKRWVFFVHGFHQDPDENIGKAIALQTNHNVNVIVFAWPSRPLDKTVELSDLGKAAIKDALMGTPPLGIISNQALTWVKGKLADFWENYSPANDNAMQSDIDLIAALELLKDETKFKNKLVLLVHSMGNFLLKNTLNKREKLPFNFNNIVLHQADVTVPGYDWVYKLLTNLEKNANLYITTNYNDSVLLASKARRVVLKAQGALPLNASTERLGKYIQNPEAGDIRYLDFTCGSRVNDMHEFFKFSAEKTNPHIHACLGRIFRADIKGDGLPAANNNSANGFSKMPTVAHLYRLEKVIHLVDYIDGKDENDVLLVTSLSQFDTGKDLKYANDPSFDDDYYD